jgi:hypothetical protein
MSNLSSAEQLLQSAKKSSGRKPEAQFRDLCQAVERILAYLKEKEKKEKPKTVRLVG